MEELLKDTRFAHVAKDPKFRRMPRGQRKVKIDKRFQSMFKDKKFVVKYTVDKRGRPVEQTSMENLRKYYDLSSSEDEADHSSIVKDKENKTKQKVKRNISNSDAKDNKTSDNEDKSNEQEGSQSGVDDDFGDDNCISSNGELLRIKPKDSEDTAPVTSEDYDDSDTEGNASDTKISKADIAENKKQLHIARKHEEKLSEEIKERLKDLSVDYARGEGVLLTDSSSEEESSEYSDEDEEIEHDWGELDKEAETTNEVTHRLAVCNMDWDRIRAVDLMVLLVSFLPSGGLIHSVTIYPSEFGLQRMKEEEIKGPIELVESKNEEKEDDDDDNEEGSRYHMEKLRQYQLNRLKYYYAVVEFDSPETANKIYTECDGIEYESTATKLDLRFIPDDMNFDQTPRETCTDVPELSKYQPRQFTTTALQQVKVDLTWDETNPERQEIAQKLNSGKLDEVNETDMQAYLGSGSSDDSEAEGEGKEKDEVRSDSDTNGDPIEKYKSLLKSIEEQEEAKKNKEVELEFTWGIGAKEKTEKLVKERMKKNEELTPFEQYMEKRKAKRKAKQEERKKLREAREGDLLDSDASEAPTGSVDENDPQNSSEDDQRRKAELELLLMDKTDEDKRHFNMKEIEENATMSKSKRKRLSKKKAGQDERKEDNFEVNVGDPRFNALFTSHHFNIDPADPHYRKTKGTEALIHEKLKRRTTDDIQEAKPKQPKTEQKFGVELQALVKSVKKNARNISRPIK